MAKHRTRVGVDARNAVRLTDGDYALVRLARIETLKTMSQTEPGAYKRLRQENPNLEFIVRLFDDRVRNGSRPAPSAFVERAAPILNALKPYATKFEIHNEPNHATGLEGWGATDAHARDFASWYAGVVHGLRQACPWAKLGFPGLALNSPHRDLEWLNICREAVKASDWLGCHCYWQYGNMLSDEWGLRFKLYHKRFPDKRIEITEFGNSTPNLSPGEMSQQYVRYYQELNRYPYLGSASAFIASSADPAWAPFAWMRDGGQMQPVVQAVGSMERKAVEVVSERLFTKTGKKVRGSFLDFYDKYGSDVCGNPITDQIKENGLATQYFERIGMQEVKAGKIQLKAVGAEAWNSRPKIAALQALVDRLSAQPLPTVEGVIDELSDLTASLAAQIQAAQQALSALEDAPPAALGDPAKLITSVGEKIKSLQALSDKLHAELATALKAMSEEQTALIGHLRAQVQDLEKQLKDSQAPPPAPGPAPGGIAKPDMEYIVDRLPKHPTEKYSQRNRSEVKTLVIHHSATAANVLPESIAKYHVDEWHWPGLGYHFTVASNGKISQTNDLETVSYHAAPVNQQGVGICFLGSFMQQPPPSAQLKAGAQLVAWLLQELHLAPDAIQGHRELMQTACPGDQWLSGAQWKTLLLQQVVKLRK